MTIHPSHPSPRLTCVASVAAPDDTVTAMIYRHTESTGSGPGLVVITVDGDVDHDTAPYLDRVLRRTVASGQPVCCDLSRTGFFGSAGARVVAGAATTGGTFSIRGARKIIRRTLETAGVDCRSATAPRQRPRYRKG